MVRQEKTELETVCNKSRRKSRLADYRTTASGLAAGCASLAASEGEAVVISNSTLQPFGVNQEVNIDFNSDGQIDFQIDHDRVNFNGTDLDYLQIDKNDETGAANFLDIPAVGTSFPLNGTVANNDHGVLSFTNEFNDLGGYAVALRAGDEIGADSLGSLVAGTIWDFQEGDNFLGGGTTIRANRLIDEDAGQLDETLGGKIVTLPFGPQPEFPDLDDWLGLEGETRFLGVRIDLNDAGLAQGNNDPSQYWYGWIGLQIDNEADATGSVTGWGYESEMGVSIAAGAVGASTPGDFDVDGDVDGADFVLWQQQFGGPLGSADYAAWEGAFGATASAQAAAATTHAVPEPNSLLLALCLGSVLLFGAFWNRRARRKTVPCVVRSR